MKPELLTFEKYSIKQFFDILLNISEPLTLTEETEHKITDSRKIIDHLGNKNIPIYGVTTGFGEMINRLIPNEFATELQNNLIRTHATGAGKRLHPLIVRAIMLARIITFTRGHSGISLDVVKTLLELYNAQKYPVIHAQGSLGASGDLSPLAELALGLLNENEFFYFESMADLTKYYAGIYDEVGFYIVTKLNKGFNPVQLSYKEGLSLINGTSAMTAIAIFTARLTEQVYHYAMMSTAMSLIALKASSMPFDPTGVELKGHPSMEVVAELLNYYISDAGLIRKQDEIIQRLTIELSKGVADHKVYKTNEFLQNAYSLRCIPQVVGGLLEILHLVSQIIEHELNGVNDNPITVNTLKYGGENVDGFHNESYIYHGAHFHGQYIAYAMDWLKIPVIQLAQLSERRIARLIDSKYNEGLPDLLASDKEGLQCAFEGLQYTATSVLAEMKTLSIPASIQSIPSNLNNQDVVSMGMLAARQAYEVADNAVTVVAVELRTALQALELRVRKEITEENNTTSFEVLLERFLGTPVYTIYKYLTKTLHCTYYHTDRNLREELQAIRNDIISSMFTTSSHPLFKDLYEQEFI